jgi:hypothetical protein
MADSAVSKRQALIKGGLKIGKFARTLFNKEFVRSSKGDTGGVIASIFEAAQSLN